MASLGYTLLLIALVVTAYTISMAVVGHHTKRPRLVVSAEFGVYALFGLLTSAAFVLVYLFVTNDYSVKYVQHYSDRSMPLFYKITAIWGGQDGSLLFWVWVMSVWSAIAVVQNRDRNREIMPYTIVTMSVVCAYFLGLLVFICNPFETYLASAPTDGRGLNPLLQNPYMVSHPPSLYLGYIGWTIPFCFAIGALAHGKLDYSWIASMRRWCLVAWVCLSVGLTLGGLWAYEELGWGGYWAWDPVENAALIPWFTGTAFIHSIQVQERRQMYKMWNLVLIILTFMLTLWGTMMTRSGIVQSVHAFAQSSIGEYFLIFISVVLLISFGLLYVRRAQLAPENSLESVVSREFAFLANNWVLLAAAFFVTFATMFPSIFKWVKGEQINVGPSFFNIWMIPIGLVLLFLTGVGPLLSWRKSTGATIREQFTLPGILALLTFGAFWFALGITHPAAVITFALSVFVTATILQEFYRGTRYRMKNAQEGPIDAFVTLLNRASRRYGGYIVHFGIVLMFVGFAGNAFKLEKEASVTRGHSVSIGRFDVRLDDLVFEDDGQKNMATAKVSVFDLGADQSKATPIATLEPAKWSYRKPEDQVTTEVAKLMSLRDDLYLVLGGYDAEVGTAALQLKVNPLVNIVWLGCAFLMFGLAVAIWPARQRAAQASALRRLWPAVAGSGALLIGLMATILAFV